MRLTAMVDTTSEATTHPGLEALERIAFGGVAAPSEARHLDECDRCRREVAGNALRVATHQFLARTHDALGVLRLDRRAQEIRLDLLDDLVAQRLLLA